MEKLIEDIIKKISRYEIITNLIPGAAFCFLLQKLGYQVLCYDVFSNVVICYLAGIVNGRIGSLLIEEFLRAIKVTKWRSYDLYNKAKKKKPFIATLQETANMYRAFAAVLLNVLLVIIYSYVTAICPWLASNKKWVAVLLLFILFVVAYCKQINDYVVKNIDEANNEE